MAETCFRKLQTKCHLQASEFAAESGMRKIMARDFDDEWLQESSDTL